MATTGSQVINGVTYVYEDMAFWNAQKSRGEHKRNYIGKMVDGTFVPNKRYLLQQQLEKQEDISPKRGPVPSKHTRRLFCGSTYLLDCITDKAGIGADLKSCFPDIWQQLLSVAYFLALEPQSPLYRFDHWAQSHSHPLGGPIPSQRSSELIGMIREDAKASFFRKQAERCLSDEYLAYDTTSVSSYSQNLRQVKWGKNKDHDPLAQINLALLYGERSRLPVYYRKLPGNMVDSKTVLKLLSDIDFLQTGKAMLVMDRGFTSESNVNALYREHCKFLMGAKLSLRFLRKRLDETRVNLVTRANYSPSLGVFMQGHSMEWDYVETKSRSKEEVKGKRRISVHFYYNEQHATDDRMHFYRKLDAFELLMDSGKLKEEDRSACERYYDIRETPARGLTYTPREEAIAEAEKDFGYFALISNGEKDPAEALRIYRSKDLIEKAFCDLKDRLNMRRTSVSSEENLEGKLFVQFLALIYLSYIKKAMEDNDLFRTYTMQGLLDELDIIETFQYPGKRATIGEMTNKQKKLYEAFGFPMPS